MLCPICGNTCINSTICDLCGFDGISPNFVNRNDAEDWRKNIVEPYRQRFYSEHLSSIELYINWSWFDNNDEYELIKINATAGKRFLKYERVRSIDDFTKWSGEKN